MSAKKPPAKVLVPLLVWDTAWKALAIWAAWRNKQYKWVPALAAVNSAGILPMVYLKFFQDLSRWKDADECAGCDCCDGCQEREGQAAAEDASHPVQAA